MKNLTKKENWKAIEKQRDKVLKAFVMFRELGDDKKAEISLNLAVQLNQIRTDLEKNNLK